MSAADRKLYAVMRGQVMASMRGDEEVGILTARGSRSLDRAPTLLVSRKHRFAPNIRGKSPYSILH